MTQVQASIPLVALYLVQAFTYSIVAASYRRARHRDLAICYGVSVLLHLGFATCHLMRLG